MTKRKMVHGLRPCPQCNEIKDFSREKGPFWKINKFYCSLACTKNKLYEKWCEGSGRVAAIRRIKTKHTNYIQALVPRLPSNKFKNKCNKVVLAGYTEYLDEQDPKERFVESYIGDEFVLQECDNEECPIHSLNRFSLNQAKFFSNI